MFESFHVLGICYDGSMIHAGGLYDSIFFLIGGLKDR